MCIFIIFVLLFNSIECYFFLYLIWWWLWCPLPWPSNTPPVASLSLNIWLYLWICIFFISLGICIYYIYLDYINDTINLAQPNSDLHSCNSIYLFVRMMIMRRGKEGKKYLYLLSLSSHTLRLQMWFVHKMSVFMNK